MQRWVVLLEFGSHEWEEVVAIEVSFGAFSEVLLVVAQPVVADGLAGVQQHVFVPLARLRFFKRGDDFRLIKAQELIVVGMRQFMQNHGGMLEHLLLR